MKTSFVSAKSGQGQVFVEGWSKDGRRIPEGWSKDSRRMREGIKVRVEQLNLKCTGPQFATTLKQPLLTGRFEGATRKNTE